LIPTPEAEGIGNRKTKGNTATATFMASMLAMAEGKHPHPSRGKKSNQSTTH
jgi:hypothetical protein